MTDTYAITKRPFKPKDSKSMQMIIPSAWPFVPGEVVNMLVSTLDGSVTRMDTVAIRKLGDSRYVPIYRNLNMPDDEMYTIMIKRASDD